MFTTESIPQNTAVLVPLQELRSFFQDIVRNEVRSKAAEDLQEKLLSPEETCKLFTPAISKPTLESYYEKGYLQKYYLEGRTWYKYSEVLAALKTIKKYSRQDSQRA
jgi:hypothetical protein